VTQPVKISKEDFKADLSQALFDVYINGILAEWNKDNSKGMQITRRTRINPFLCKSSGLIAESDTCLQISVHKLGNDIDLWTNNNNNQQN
jgi:hypothetical protein